MARYPIPEKEARTEIMVLNSRFVAAAGPAFSVDQARDFIVSIKRDYPDASHHVPAFLIGFGSSVIAHCSDAGEPAGTAGRPALAVLQGSGLGDVVAVVTRYFGGTKLGTGGLVRAYTDAVKEVLKVLPRAEKIATHIVMIVFDYSFFERIRLLVLKKKGIIMDTDFGGDITLTARLAVETFDEFQAELIELTRGVIRAEIIQTEPDTIMPIGSF